LTTKIHAIVDALGNPVALSLTPGQSHDITQAVPLLDQVEPDAFLADKGYDSDALIATLEARGITPVIPPKANRRAPRKTDFALYCERNLRQGHGLDAQRWSSFARFLDDARICLAAQCSPTRRLISCVRSVSTA
jgi:transposase